MIEKFEGEYSFLSNSYNNSICYKGVIYDNAESAYQSCKLKLKFDRLQFRNLSGEGARVLGRKIPLREDWEEIKFTIMREIIENKFKYNPVLKIKLKETGEKKLIKTNYEHDNFWGNCKCSECEGIVGLNNLGKILMIVRAYKK